jgi:hypothetical protein
MELKGFLVKDISLQAHRCDDLNFLCSYVASSLKPMQTLVFFEAINANFH